MTAGVGEPSERVTVVGIGADGWAGLSVAARLAVEGADVVVGGARALGYLPGEVRAERIGLPVPLADGLPGLLAAQAGHRVCFLASGDPMHYGIGSTLVRLLGADAVRVIGHPSSVSLACARLGWSVEDTLVLSAVGRSPDRLRAMLAPGQRLLVLSSGTDTPAQVCTLLRDCGYGDSEVTVLEQLDGPNERITRYPAAAGGDVPDPLNVVAIEATAGPGTALFGATAGLPDDAYDHDGQITRREIRALTLARLAPRAGELLWDVGGGAGSVGIEWMRAARGARAIAVERRGDRAARIGANAARLGVPDLSVVVGSAPAALADLPTPDAVFIGGGGSDPAVFEACWAALRPGGRLVANAVTLQTEAALVDRCALFGGELVRLEVSHAVPLGRFTGWRAQHPVTQWAVTR